MDTKIVQGSSPRMRGTRVMQCDNRACGGIIPAYAGNTIQMRKAIFNNRDHPRVCGEHPWYLTSTPSGWRIIPAYAGNTPKRRSVAPRSRDHPRVCGEHRPAISKLTRALGSSPRMRGTRYRMVFATPVCGIIPAYAGNTNRQCEFAETHWDHPRVCGEHGCAICVERADWGSSPRMRGTPACKIYSRRSPGIIPAYAGNTRVCRLAWLDPWDHPRVCGEHCCGMAWFIATTGSSPRMRGTPVSLSSVVSSSRIIPAYAGNTLVYFVDIASDWDHPRVCGEHICGISRFIFFQGSSPRMRGTLIYVGYT